MIIFDNEKDLFRVLKDSVYKLKHESRLELIDHIIESMIISPFCMADEYCSEVIYSHPGNCRYYEECSILLDLREGLAQTQQQIRLFMEYFNNEDYSSIKDKK